MGSGSNRNNLQYPPSAVLFINDIAVADTSASPADPGNTAGGFKAGGSGASRLMTVGIEPSTEAITWTAEVWGKLIGSGALVGWGKMATTSGTGSTLYRVDVDGDIDDFDVLITVISAGTIDAWVAFK